MIAWAYTVVRNEALILPYWLRHYATFCDRMIVYDDKSDDGTPDLARAGGAEVRAYPFAGFDDIEMVGFANNQYREAEGSADFVIWADADEFLFDPHMRERLDRFTADGITLPVVQGYAMVGDAVPTRDGQIYDEIVLGFAHDRYSKPCILRPSVDLRWDVGKHEAKVLSPAKTNTDEPLKLLHYRYLGEAYHDARNARNWARLSKRQRQFRLGYETAPDWQGDYSARWYEAQRAGAVNVC